jgi:deoxyribodipyrimidine photo-lyase
VFSPFARTWSGAPRRTLVPAPRALSMPAGVKTGRMPSLAALGVDDPPKLAFDPGETAARKAMAGFLRTRLEAYEERRDFAAGGSSRLSPYMRWGCLSPLELERKVNEHSGEGASSYRNEIAWRDFYSAVLIHFPHVVKQEFQERYRDLEWASQNGHFDAWRDGRTGYPFVDAGMRQLRAEGWIHNRARLVAASFLTKELGIDWRRGERWFMRLLIDGDEANNNGNWQWIASVGVDPQPYFRRMYSPTRHMERYDPDGAYVRRHVPELRSVADEHLREPWLMPRAAQEACGCVIGRDYPKPVVDRSAARRRAAERYRAAANAA